MNIVQKQQNQPEQRTQAASQRVEYLMPLVDIESTAEGYLIRAEMPGVDKSGLEITVEDGELTILGRRRDSRLAGEPVYREIRHHDYKRVYELGPDIDAARIGAKIDQGLLTLSLPKAKKVRPRKIDVE
jgi:HSP20 family protein